MSSRPSCNAGGLSCHGFKVFGGLIKFAPLAGSPSFLNLQRIEESSGSPVRPHTDVACAVERVSVHAPRLFGRLVPHSRKSQLFGLIRSYSGLFLALLYAPRLFGLIRAISPAAVRSFAGPRGSSPVILHGVEDRPGYPQGLPNARHQ